MQQVAQRQKQMQKKAGHVAYKEELIHQQKHPIHVIITSKKSCITLRRFVILIILLLLVQIFMHLSMGLLPFSRVRIMKMTDVEIEYDSLLVMHKSLSVM